MEYWNDGDYKMKSTPIWKDPAGWIEYFAKTRTRVVLWSLVHFLGTIGCMYIFRESERLLSNLSGTETNAPQNMGFFICLVPLIFLGGFFPSAYLYVAYRLLKMSRTNP